MCLVRLDVLNFIFFLENIYTKTVFYNQYSKNLVHYIISTVQNQSINSVTFFSYTAVICTSVTYNCIKKSMRALN